MERLAGLGFAARPARRSRQRFSFSRLLSWATTHLGHGATSDPPEPGNDFVASCPRWGIADSWLARLTDLESLGSEVHFTLDPQQLDRDGTVTMLVGSCFRC